MSWLYTAADVVTQATPSAEITQALIVAALEWQRAGVRPTIAEMLLLSPDERAAWLEAGRRLENDDYATPTEAAVDILDHWDEL